MLHGDLGYNFNAQRPLEIRREVERNRLAARLKKFQASSRDDGSEKLSFRKITAARIATLLAGLFKPPAGADS